MGIFHRISRSVRHGMSKLVSTGKNIAHLGANAARFVIEHGAAIATASAAAELAHKHYVPEYAGKQTVNNAIRTVQKIGLVGEAARVYFKDRELNPSKYS